MSDIPLPTPVIMSLPEDPTVPRAAVYPSIPEPLPEPAPAVADPTLSEEPGPIDWGLLGYQIWAGAVNCYAGGAAVAGKLLIQSSFSAMRYAAMLEAKIAEKQI